MSEMLFDEPAPEQAPEVERPVSIADAVDVYLRRWSWRNEDAARRELIALIQDALKGEIR